MEMPKQASNQKVEGLSNSKNVSIDNLNTRKVKKKIMKFENVCSGLICMFLSTPLAAVPTLLRSLSARFCGTLSPSLPGPPSLLLLGNMLDLAQEHLPIHLTSLALRYGNIYRLNCGNTSNYYFYSISMIEKLIATGDMKSYYINVDLHKLH